MSITRKSRDQWLQLQRLAILTAVFGVGVAACGGGGISETSVITPARELAGDWVTQIPVRVRHEYNFCDGSREVYGQADVTLRLLIEEVPGKPNEVEVDFWELSQTNWSPLPTKCSSNSNNVAAYYVAGEGNATLSATAFSFATTKGGTTNGITYSGGQTLIGTFTTDLIAGTLQLYICRSSAIGTACDGYSTATGAVKFVRQ